MKSGMRPTRPRTFPSGNITPKGVKPNEKGFKIKTGTSSYERRSIKPTGSHKKPC